MTSFHIFSPRRTALLFTTIALVFAGCKSKPAQLATDGASITTQVQARLSSDQNLNGQSVQAIAASGVVTLSGNVASNAARSAAASDAAQVPGVRTVVNNLVVQSAAPVSAQVTPPPAPVVATMHTLAPTKSAKPSAAIPRAVPQPAPQPPPAPIVRSYPTPQPSPVQPVQAQLPPPPPPQPVIHTITLPAGTSIPVRITQTLDSATSQDGDRFTGSIAADIILDNLVVLHQGTPVSGRVDSVREAGHFKGSSLLSISLTSIERHGERVQVATDSYTREGEGRGKNTVEKTGGGAVVGAILGGIFGGGRGAAIGAAAGGGVAAGSNGITRGQQAQIESETVVRFRLTNPLLLQVTTGPHPDRNYDAGLERHNNQ